MKPRIGLVVSTMLDGIHRLHEHWDADWDEVVVVHQIPGVTDDRYTEVHAQLRAQGVQLIVQPFNGLSKSRNAGLAAVTAEYALITDDDVVFPPQVHERIHHAIAQYPQADILSMQIQTTEGRPFKSYASEAYRHTLRSIARVSSIEMLMRTKAVQSLSLKFDERFGLGAPFATGEEFIFLHDALRAGARAYYVPTVISIHPLMSSGKILDAPQCVNKGAMLARVYGRWSGLYSFAFAWKKRKALANGITVRQAMHLMATGRKQFRAHD